MGEGFVVLETADCKITYYQDEPGQMIHSILAGVISIYMSCCMRPSGLKVTLSRAFFCRCRFIFQQVDRQLKQYHV